MAAMMHKSWKTTWNDKEGVLWYLTSLEWTSSGYVNEVWTRAAGSNETADKNTNTGKKDASASTTDADANKKDADANKKDADAGKNDADADKKDQDADVDKKDQDADADKNTDKKSRKRPLPTAADEDSQLPDAQLLDSQESGHTLIVEYDWTQCFDVLEPARRES